MIRPVCIAKMPGSLKAKRVSGHTRKCKNCPSSLLLLPYFDTSVTIGTPYFFGTYPFLRPFPSKFSLAEMLDYALPVPEIGVSAINDDDIIVPMVLIPSPDATHHFEKNLSLNVILCHQGHYDVASASSIAHELTSRALLL